MFIRILYFGYIYIIIIIKPILNSQSFIDSNYSDHKILQYDIPVINYVHNRAKEVL